MIKTKTKIKEKNNPELKELVILMFVDVLATLWILGVISKKLNSKANGAKKMTKDVNNVEVTGVKVTN